MRLFKHYIFFYALAILCTRGFGQTAAAQANDDPYFHILELKPGESPEQKVNSLIFLQVSVSKSSVYAGETFLAEYKLYRAVASDPVPFKQPAFNGCSVLELNPFNDSTSQTINGVRYMVNVLRKVQLMPLQEGPLLLDEATISNTVQYISDDSPGHIQTVRVETTSKPLTVEVKPLPEKNQPASFTGITGNFTIDAKLASSRLQTGENGKLTLVIKGTGNVAGVTLPAINWPAATQHFESTASEHIQHDSFPAGGDKTFEIPFIGSQEGSATIPPVYFVFFNPQTQNYDSVHTDSLRLQFTKVAAKQTIREIMAEDLDSRVYIWIVPALAVVVGVIIIASSGSRRRRQRNAPPPHTPKNTEPKAMPAMSPPAKKIDLLAELKALGAINDNATFYRRSKQVLTLAIMQKLNRTALDEGEAVQELKAKTTDDSLVERAATVYKISNLNLYSPVANSEQRTRVLDELREIFTLLQA